LLFHRSVVCGSRAAVRCPRNTTRIPTWNGTAPQNRDRPSRNCDESEETLKPLERYRWMAPIRKIAVAA
jgi:hypothetical protein